MSSNVREPLVGFGPEDTDIEQVRFGPDSDRILLDTDAAESDQPPVPEQSLAPATESPAGEPPAYMPPIDPARRQALAPRAPGVSPPGPIPTGESLVVHHVMETMTRAAETAIPHKVLTLSHVATQIMGKNDRRTKAYLKNTSTNTVVTVGMDETVTPGGVNGWDIAATDPPLEINHRDQMWAVIPASSSGSLQVFETVSEVSPTQLATLKAQGSGNGKQRN